MLTKRSFLMSCITALLPKPSWGDVTLNKQSEHILISTQKSPFPPYWKECVGSGRAIQALRKEWLDDLKFIKQTCGFKSVRFHGLLNDEVGLCRDTCNGEYNLNYLYIDHIFDSIIDLGMKPFVEISFMPSPLRSGNDTIFWYKANTSPPKDPKEWSHLIKNLIEHLINRYGIYEIKSWKFEVWNEPNINFWSKDQRSYFLLFEETYKAIKSVNPDIAVGGPATAQMGWLSDFLTFCQQANIRPDFLSSHVYDHDPQEKIFDKPVHYAFSEVIPKAIQYAKQKISASSRPNIPFYITEWTSQNPAYILKMIYECAGQIDIFSYWTFNTLIEENGPVPGFNQSYFGLLDFGSLPRPSFHAFFFLNKLSPNKLNTNSKSILATEDEKGRILSVVWNYQDDDKTEKEYTITLTKTYSSVLITYYDPQTDPILTLWHKMGSPPSPTHHEYNVLQNSSLSYSTFSYRLTRQNSFSFSLPPNAIAFIEIE